MNNNDAPTTAPELNPEPLPPITMEIIEKGGFNMPEQTTYHETLSNMTGVFLNRLVGLIAEHGHPALAEGVTQEWLGFARAIREAAEEHGAVYIFDVNGNPYPQFEAEIRVVLDEAQMEKEQKEEEKEVEPKIALN